jgi:hypothetical protein
MAMKNKYPVGRTFTQWRLLSYKERNAWVTQQKCDRLGCWALCTKKKRCRRHRSCRGNQFACYWSRRSTLSPAQCARDDARCADLDALLAGGALAADATPPTPDPAFADGRGSGPVADPAREPWQ